MLPYAATGVIFGYYNIIEKIKNKKYKVIIISLILMLGIAIWNCDHIRIPAGFGYQGMKLWVLSVGIVIMFSTLPNKIFGNKISKIIKTISKYSLGIYCSHIAVGKILNLYLEQYGINTKTFYDCILIWLISYIVSWTISKIPVKAIQGMAT